MQQRECQEIKPTLTRFCWQEVQALTIIDLGGVRDLRSTLRFPVIVGGKIHNEAPRRWSVEGMGIEKARILCNEIERSVLSTANVPALPRP